MFKATRRAGLLAALAAAATVLPACGDEPPAASGPRELKLWHYEGPTSAMGVAWAEAIKEFESSHPNVKVKFEERGFEQIRQTAAQVLNSNEAPDIMEYNKGNASAGLLSRQGLLTDMSAEVTKRGWDKLLTEHLQTTCKYDNRGVMGGDKWFGVTNYAEYVLVYYNKNLFERHGVQVPTTFDEFVAAMDKFVQAGVTPLSVGGAEYPAQQVLYQLALSKADRDWVDAFQRYTGEVDFHDEAWTYAANTFADWVSKGYVSKNAAGIKAEDMGVAFSRGDYPMMVSGSWWYGRLVKEITNFQWDVFLWPGNTFNAGSGGNLWVVPNNAKNKDLAYDFIDITMRKNIQNLFGNNGGVPVAADDSAVTDEKTKALIGHFEHLVDNDGLAFYPDWPVPGYYDVMVAATQKLINGSASPDQVLDELARPYDEHVSTIGQ